MHRKRTIKGVRIFVVFLLCLLMLINVYYIIEKVALNNELPKIFGYSDVVVVSGSMEPTLEIGDLLIIHEQKKYDIDNIVTFQGDTRLVTHRVVEVAGSLYTTKGDSNNVNDTPQTAITEIQGKMVLRLRGIGNIVFFLKSPFGMLVVIFGLLAIIELPEYLRSKRSSEK